MKTISSAFWVALAMLAAVSLPGGASVRAAADAHAKTVLFDQFAQPLTQLTSFAGSREYGAADGPVAAAAFRLPQSVLALNDGSVLVADTQNQLIRKVSGRTVATFAGIILEKDNKNMPLGSLADGDAAMALFNHPTGLAADAHGSIYIADAGNHAIRKITAAGQVVTVAGDGTPGHRDGPGKEARFNHPTDVAVAADGTVYVADTLNHAIRKIAANGNVTTLNAFSDRVVEVAPGQVVPVGDFRDDQLAEAKFNEPSGLAFDANGNLYVSDSGNQRIRYIDLATGSVVTAAGGGMAANGKSPYEADALYAQGAMSDGAANQARFNFPRGIALDANGGLLIADSLNHAVRYLLNGKVYTLSGSETADSGYQDGLDRHTLLQMPADVTIAANGEVLVADAYNNVIRRLDFYRLPDAALASKEKLKLVYDNELLFASGGPEIVNNRAMAPIREIAGKLGFKVESGAGDNTVALTKADKRLAFTISGMQAQLSDADADIVTIPLDAAPYVRQDETFIPVRSIELLGIDVQWSERQRTVILRSYP